MLDVYKRQPLIGVALVCEALRGVLRLGVVSSGGLGVLVGGGLEGVGTAALVASARASPVSMRAAAAAAETSNLGVRRLIMMSNRRCWFLC